MDKIIRDKTSKFYATLHDKKVLDDILFKLCKYKNLNVDQKQRKATIKLLLKRYKELNFKVPKFKESDLLKEATDLSFLTGVALTPSKDNGKN